MMMEVVVTTVDYWSYKSYKAPVKSSPPTNQHPVFLQAGCPSCRPTNSVKALKGTTLSCYYYYYLFIISYLYSAIFEEYSKCANVSS